MSHPQELGSISNRPWHDPIDISLPSNFYKEIGGNPLIPELLFRRGYQDLSSISGFLNPKEYHPASPFDLPGMEQAVDRLELALKRKETIAVWGDFDVDGQTATTILVSILRNLGAQVVYHIPVRAIESHGVNIDNLVPLIEAGASVLITCDTGITAHEATEFARQNGIDVLITDHHDLPATLPVAESIVNPKLLPPAHPLAALPGVGVAYQVAKGLSWRLKKTDLVESNLDLVALGIVSDVASLVGDTRYLLQLGLEALRTTQRVGLNHMIELAELNKSGISEEHVGFVLGPRLNALGRLGDANWIVEFLTTQDPGRAHIMALQLEGLNHQRKLMTDQVFQGAVAQVNRDPASLAERALVLTNQNWPAGVIGIVASRLVDHYQKPVILISTPPGEAGRGSARSINGVNITAAIAQTADLLNTFGGHPMAAGLSINPENIPEFRNRLSRAIQDQVGDVVYEQPLQVDAYLSLGSLSFELAEDLERLAPFGPGNPSITLATLNLKLTHRRTIGKDREHLLLTVEDLEGTQKDIIWWQGAGWDIPEGQFDLAYTVHATTYRGERSVQITWIDSRPSQEISIPVELPPRQFLDYRQNPSPLARLNEFLQEGNLQVWREGQADKEIPGQNRWELTQAETLVVWTIPPGRDELLQAIDQVQPQRVVFFANDPGGDDPKTFLELLVGFVKHVQRTASQTTSLQELAAATAQRTGVVSSGLEFLQNQGKVSFVERKLSEKTIIKFSEPSQATLKDTSLQKEQIRFLLKETRAYRNYYIRSSLENLL